MARASVIVLTYSNPENIPRIEEALRDEDIELIIAEDGSTHFTNCTRFKHITHERSQPWQCAKARNEGARLATTPYLLFLDDDYVPEPGWVDAHLAALADYDVSIGEYDPEATIIAGVAYCPRPQAVDEGLAAIWQVAYTGNLGVRAQAWRDVGGFDERYGGHYGHEDTDFGHMLYLAGKRFTFSRDARVKRVGTPGVPKTYEDIAPNAQKHAEKFAQGKRILMVYPGHAFSTYEVARGYTIALRHLGHMVEVFDYENAYTFFARACRQAHPELDDREVEAMALQEASRQLAPLILTFVPQVVVVVCGMALAPEAYDYAYRLGVPLIVILTESPYLDDRQARMLVRGHVRACTVNDKASLDFMRGICRAEYLPHSYDPNYHYPREPLDGYEPADVVFVGTMYQERQEFFSAINWQGIKLKLLGTQVQFFLDGAISVSGGVSNEEAVEHYRAAKIGLTLHRLSRGVVDGDLSRIGAGEAYSLGPRTFEQAACGLFQLADDQRAELRDVFGDSVPTFRGPADAERLIRYYLAHESERCALAQIQRESVKNCTFVHRAQEVLLPLIEEVI